MAKEQHCDLLIVQDLRMQARYAVKAPARKAQVGHLVRFETFEDTVLGRVLDLTHCSVTGDYLRCAYLLGPVYEAREIYCIAWEASRETPLSG